LIAGHETTTNLIGNGVLALLRNPDQLELLKSKPDLMPTAIDEFLRYDSPVQMVRRIAADNFQIGDTTIKSGQHVVPLIGAANHDPDQFKDPETLDITREDNKHISFGHGIHHCLGWSLAGAEGQIAISALLKTFPNIKMKTQKIEVKLPFSLRGVKQLHVTY
jgi:cytochrome P450